MKLQIFSVYDNAAGAYLPPFFVQTTGLAIRSFQDAVNDPNHQFHKHALDYTLFLLGEFDDSDATFATHTVPIKISTGAETRFKDITPSPQ